MKAAIATTILKQLGGIGFAVMTGAKDFVGLESGLMFRIPKAKDGINRVRVVLTPADDYTVEFWRTRRTSATLVETRDRVYCDQLQAVFTSVTGLHTRF